MPSDVGKDGISLTRRPLPPAGTRARPGSRHRRRPGPGAAVRAGPGVADSRIGFRTVGTSPARATGSRPRLSASSTPPLTSLMGPQAMPASLSRPNHSCADLAASRSSSSGRSSSRLTLRRPTEAEPLVVGQFRRAQHLGQPAELAVVAGRDDQVAVPGGQRLVREQAEVGVAHPVRDHPARHVGRGLVDHGRQRAGEQVGLDVLALAGQVAVVQRGQDADRRVQPGEHVEHRDAGPERRRVRGAGQAHQPGHALGQDVVPGHGRALARAEPADRGSRSPPGCGRPRCRSPGRIAAARPA